MCCVSPFDVTITSAVRPSKDAGAVNEIWVSPAWPVVGEMVSHSTLFFLVVTFSSFQSPAAWSVMVAVAPFSAIETYDEESCRPSSSVIELSLLQAVKSAIEAHTAVTMLIILFIVINFV